MAARSGELPTTRMPCSCRRGRRNGRDVCDGCASVEFQGGSCWNGVVGQLVKLCDELQRPEVAAGDLHARTMARSIYLSILKLVRNDTGYHKHV